jgi:hypothetical protein
LCVDNTQLPYPLQPTSALWRALCSCSSVETPAAGTGKLKLAVLAMQLLGPNVSLLRNKSHDGQLTAGVMWMLVSHDC